ncbi:unnamed protein product [Gongylonema pulchrum]|uniref:Protein CUSTOS n=1 Tax=Gongylonema pulchrum TaxID=637853 RepID=A0A183DIR3_9BILA|nr:unnamed protein product [Gongylonema pulchrum]
MDDVFGAYSTDDESTKHSMSRCSIVPSLYKEKDEKDEEGSTGKRRAKKATDTSTSFKEKTTDKNSACKKEKRKEKVNGNDEEELSSIDHKKEVCILKIRIF